jgi:hypothetical protein
LVTSLQRILARWPPLRRQNLQHREGDRLRNVAAGLPRQKATPPSADLRVIVRALEAVVGLHAGALRALCVIAAPSG